MEDLNLEQIQAIEDVAERNAKLLDYAKAQEEARLKLQSDTDKGVKQITDEKKMLELVQQEAKALLQDKNYFPTLLAKDEWLAQKVLDEFFSWISIEDALAQLDDETKAKVQEETKGKDLEATVKNILTKEKVDSKISSFIKKIKLSDEEKTLFDKEFEELTEGKSLNWANIEKYLRLAYKEAIPEGDYSSIEKDAKDMAIHKGWFAQQKSTKHNARKDNIEYLKKQWFF